MLLLWLLAAFDGLFLPLALPFPEKSVAFCASPPSFSLERKVPGPCSSASASPARLSGSWWTWDAGLLPLKWWAWLQKDLLHLGTREEKVASKGSERKGNPPSSSQIIEIQPTVIVQDLGQHTSLAIPSRSLSWSQCLWTPMILAWSLNYLLPFMFIHLSCVFSLLQTVRSFRDKAMPSRRSISERKEGKMKEKGMSCWDYRFFFNL